MDPETSGWKDMGDVEVTKFEERQWLVIRVNSLTSTLTFALDTLVQHRTMIFELQDELDTLRSQHESLKHHLAKRDAAFGISLPSETVYGMEIPETTHVLELNVPVEPVEDMDKLDNENGHN